MGKRKVKPARPGTDPQVLFLELLSSFLQCIDQIFLYWRGVGRISDVDHEATVELAYHTRERIQSLAPTLVSLTTPPPGQSSLQFLAGILDDIENAWHLCRFVGTIRPDREEALPDFERLRQEMHERLPSLRNDIWEAARHVRHVMHLTDNSSSTDQQKGRRKSSHKRKTGEPLNQILKGWQKAQDEGMTLPRYVQEVREPREIIERVLAEDIDAGWQRAKEADSTIVRSDYAKRLGISPKDLHRILNNLSQRRRRRKPR